MAGFYRSQIVARAGMCAVFAVTACSSGAGTGSSLPPGAQNVPSGPGGFAQNARGSRAASAIAYFAFGASDYCPSTKETIRIQIFAGNSKGALITGAYSPAIALSDTDTSGATQLSATTVTKASQVVTLSYSGAAVGTAIIITATVGKIRGSLMFDPGKTCLNQQPLAILLRDGAAGRSVTLAGVGVTGPYDIVTTSSGYGCGNALTIKKKSSRLFVLTSATTQFGYCFVEGEANGAIRLLGVAIFK
jgi:hypothetical protein